MLLFVCRACASRLQSHPASPLLLTSKLIKRSSKTFAIRSFSLFQGGSSTNSNATKSVRNAFASLARWFSASRRPVGPPKSARERQRERVKDTMLYVTGFVILTTALAYAAVPLYRMFCQVTAYGGTTRRAGHNVDEIESCL